VPLGVLLVVVGSGLDLGLQVAVIAGQNAVSYSYLGVATGALNFFKTIGGAFGVALFGASRTARLDGTSHSGDDLTHGFQTIFFWTIPFMAAALVLAVAMKAQPLSEEMLDVAAGNVAAGEY
jgi:hypothetical protein